MQPKILNITTARVAVTLALAAVLAILGWGSTTMAQSICPGVSFDTGWLRLDATAGVPEPDFTAGLLGTFETSSPDGAVYGDLDWLYNSKASGVAPTGTNTTTTAVQVIGWWSQKGGRNTYLQYTNTAFASEHFTALGGVTPTGEACTQSDPGCLPAPLSVHVQILDESCLEIKNFCDLYTPGDTHIYDFGDLVTNTGQDITESVLQGKEGIVVITPVVACGVDNRAINFPNFSTPTRLYATERIQDATNRTEYGVNLWRRGTISTSQSTCPDTVVPSGAEILDGTVCFWENNTVPPLVLDQNFSTKPDSIAARSDLVLLSIADSYSDVPTQGYTPVAANATYFPDIFDADEQIESCPQFTACFARLGIDDALPVSDTPLPTPTPTPTPSPSPTGGGGTASPSPSPTGGGGGGGGCAVVGVVGTGTAAANVVLPMLLPVFALGLGALRRRRRGK